MTFARKALQQMTMQRNANPMQYSANQAAELTGKNVATITRAIKSGKLSATKDQSGTWKIDGAELSRVFPLRAQSLQTPNMQNDAKLTKTANTLDEDTLREELATLRERVKADSRLLEERANHIGDLQKRLDRAEDRILALSAPAAEPVRQGRTGSDGARPSTLAAAEAERDRLQGVVQSLTTLQPKRRRWWPF
jgi:hypothetical protein